MISVADDDEYTKRVASHVRCQVGRSYHGTVFVLRVTIIAVSLFFVCGGTVSAQQEGVDRENPANKEVFQQGPSKQRSKLVIYLKPDYVKTVLGLISQDMGSDVSLSDDVEIMSLRATKGERVFILKFQTGDECGNRYKLIARSRGTKKKRGTFRKLFELECVEGVYLTTRKTFTKGYPDLLYVSGRAPKLYVTLFKYDGAQYQEAVCKVQDEAGPEMYKLVDCSRRGVMSN